MRFRAYALEARLEVQQLAASLGRSVSQVEDWLDGTSHPDEEAIRAITSLSGGRVTAEDFTAVPPTSGMLERQGGFTDLNLVLDAEVEDDLVAAARRRAEVRHWARAHRDHFTMWNAFMRRHGLPLNRQRER